MSQNIQRFKKFFEKRKNVILSIDNPICAFEKDVGVGCGNIMSRRKMNEFYLLCIENKPVPQLEIRER